MLYYPKTWCQNLLASKDMNKSDIHNFQGEKSRMANYTLWMGCGSEKATTVSTNIIFKAKIPCDNSLDNFTRFTSWNIKTYLWGLKLY